MLMYDTQIAAEKSEELMPQAGSTSNNKPPITVVVPVLLY